MICNIVLNYIYNNIWALSATRAEASVLGDTEVGSPPLLRVDSPSHQWRTCSLGGPRGYRSIGRRCRRADEGSNHWSGIPKSTYLISRLVAVTMINDLWPLQVLIWTWRGQQIQMKREQRHKLTQRSPVCLPLCRLWGLSQTLRWEEKNLSVFIDGHHCTSIECNVASLPVFCFSSDKLDHAP